MCVRVKYNAVTCNTLVTFVANVAFQTCPRVCFLLHGMSLRRTPITLTLNKNIPDKLSLYVANCANQGRSHSAAQVQRAD